MYTTYDIIDEENKSIHLASIILEENEITIVFLHPYVSFKRMA